jgi:hypothetical protein
MDALGHLASAAWHFIQAFRPCFAAGTPLLTPYGDKPIEEFKPGDWILSAPADDANGPVEAKQVEEVFQGDGRLLHLHVRGQVISTTSGHPFFVHGRNWIPAGELRPGDLLRSHDGQWSEVGEIYDTGEVVPVFNLRVAEYHTYFVGSREWGFSVWSHNASPCFGSAAFGQMVHQDFPQFIDDSFPDAEWDLNVRPGLTGPDAVFVEGTNPGLKPLSSSRSVKVDFVLLRVPGNRHV